MKIIDEQPKADGTVAVKLCLCKGKESICQPKDKVIRIFKNQGKLGAFKKAFKLGK
jgi:hypothetical protein